MIRFKKILLAAATLAALIALGAMARAADAPAGEAEPQPSPSRQTWCFSGLFGTYDQAQLQRGFKVYHEVCCNCHR